MLEIELIKLSKRRHLGHTEFNARFINRNEISMQRPEFIIVVRNVYLKLGSRDVFLDEIHDELEQ